jgi:RNA polymerase-binding protein DksA
MIDPPKLEELRAAIEEHRANLRTEIAEQGGDPDSEDLALDVEQGFADSAHSTVERSRLLSLMRALRDNLRAADRALAKMDLGTYGTCERCGNPIGIERLEALPWAILCIDCKQRGERA